MTNCWKLYIDGFLKVSPEGLTVILRHERYLLRGLLHENDNLSGDDLFEDNYSAHGKRMTFAINSAEYCLIVIVPGWAGLFV